MVITFPPSHSASQIPHLPFAEVSGPGTEPMPQQWPEPQQWQCQISLSHWSTRELVKGSFFVCLFVLPFSATPKAYGVGSNRTYSCRPTPQPQQRQILNPPSEARDWTCNLMVPSWTRFCYNTMGTPSLLYFLDSAYKWYHTVFVFLCLWLWLISLSRTPSKSICVVANGKISFFFIAE